MPPLYEGDLLYMPTTLPGLSMTKAKELLQQTDRIIRQFPEVEQRLRQDRPGRDGHRSGADDDDRDHHHAQAGRAVAQDAGPALLLRLAGVGGLGQRTCCACLWPEEVPIQLGKSRR